MINPNFDKIRKELIGLQRSHYTIDMDKAIGWCIKLEDVDQAFTQIQSLFSSLEQKHNEEIAVNRSEVYDKMNQVLKEKDEQTTQLQSQIKTLRAEAGKEWRKGYDFSKEEQKKDLLSRGNHFLGCDLESYAQVLRFRSQIKEADQLDEIASRIK